MLQQIYDGFTTYSLLIAVCNCIKYLIVCPCGHSQLPTIVQCISMPLGWAETLVMNSDILTPLTSMNEVSVRSYLVLTAAMVRYINMFEVVQ